MRFQLPQFVETEIKLIGPFTLRQFLWIAAGVSILFVVFYVAGPTWFLIAILPISAISISLAFIKINEISLINYIAYALSYLINPRKYIYKSGENKNIQLPQ
ncbi:MAG TPA: PrgI family protein [Candidatus Paceibacterota bacterium]|nr:PrgI family protein [Candidatus Paceibacterota bacterium]